MAERTILTGVRLWRRFVDSICESGRMLKLDGYCSEEPRLRCWRLVKWGFVVQRCRSYMCSSAVAPGEPSRRFLNILIFP